MPNNQIMVSFEGLTCFIKYTWKIVFFYLVNNTSITVCELNDVVYTCYSCVFFKKALKPGIFGQYLLAFISRNIESPIGLHLYI